MSDFLQQAREFFPQWTEAQQERWAKARAYSAALPPKWARLVPLTLPQTQDGVFTARTRKQAGL